MESGGWKIPDVEPEAVVVGIGTGTAGAIAGPVAGAGPGPMALCGTTADAMVCRLTLTDGRRSERKE